MKRFLFIVFVVALTFFAFKPLLSPGFFPIHDDEQIARVFELNGALADGQFPVRWVQHLGFGFGYPLFNFYPPLTYYTADFFHFLGFSFIDSTKLVFLLSFLLSFIFMYLWVRQHFGVLGGIFSAVLYTYAPYHAVEIYVRGSLPSFLSYAFLPATFFLIDKMFREKKVNTAIFLGIVLTLIPLSHILKLVSFFPFFGLYILFALALDRKELKRKLLQLILSLLVFLGLVSFFLIPSLLEKNYTLVDKVNTGELFNYKIHFVYLRQLLNSPWGYGGSIPGPEDGLSFELGKAHIIFSVLALFILVYAFAKGKINNYKIPLLILLFFILSVYMASFYSQWIWDRVQLLSYLQFPWRFLTLAAAFSSFLGGFVIYCLKKNYGGKLAFIVFSFSSIISILLVYSDFQPQKYLNVKDNYYTNLHDIEWRVSKASFEFVPRGVATKLSDIKTTQVDIEEKDIFNSPYKIIKGSPYIKTLTNKSQLKEFEVSSNADSIIQFNTFSFPGWKTSVDGKDVKYHDDNKLKLIAVDVPKGKHVLTAAFTNTLPRAVGNAITLVTIFNLIGFGLFKLWKR